VEFFLGTYPAFTRFEIIWTLPLSVGLRIQNAYIERNSDKDEKPQIDTDRYSFHYNRILREFIRK